MQNSKNKDLISDKGEPFIVRYCWWILCVILIITFLIYRNSLYGDFLNYDDYQNIVNNPRIRKLTIGNFVHFFSSSNLFMYTPITFISYAIDFQIGGLQPFYFRLTNLIFHLINILLVFILTDQLLKNKRLSIILAGFFAFHPVNVDTIAWISTRSNLLSTLFFLLTLIFYLNFLKKKKFTAYLISVLSFGLSLLSKPTAVMLPFILFIFDFYLERKLNIKLILEKIPFLMFSLIIGIIAIYFRTDTGTTQSVGDYNIPDRFFILCFSLLSYLFKVLFPFHLSEIYGYPVKINNFLSFWYYLSPMFILILIIGINRIKRLKKEIIFGLLFFLTTIIITQLTLLEDGYTANRYAYLPFFGFFFIMVVVYEYFSFAYKKIKMVLITLVLGILCVFPFISCQRAHYWMNTYTLFDHAIQQSPDAAFAYNSRGIAKYFNNDLIGALNDYNTAIKINPKYSGAYYNRGIIYHINKEYEKALNDYSKATEYNPNFASAFCARGDIYTEYFKNDSIATIDYDKAIQINPSFVQAYYNRALVKLRKKDMTNACKDLKMVQNLGYSQADGLINKYCK